MNLARSRRRRPREVKEGARLFYVKRNGSKKIAENDEVQKATFGRLEID